MKTRPWHFLGIVFAVGLLVAANTMVRQGSVMDNPLLDEENPYVVQAARGVLRGLVTEADARIDIRVAREDGGAIDREGLRRAVALCERASDYFARERRVRNVGVHCVSTARDYARDDAGSVLSHEEVSAPDFDPNKWRARLVRRADVEGVLIFDTPDSMIVTISLILPKGADESELYVALKEFMEEKSVSRFDLLFSPAIRTPENVRVVGWSVARVELYALARAGVFATVTPIILLAIFIFARGKLGSLRQTLALIAAVAFAFAATRGSITLLDFFGVYGGPWREEIFTILAYAVALIPGCSFSLRRFEAFNALPSAYRYEMRWYVSSLKTRGTFAFVAVVSAFGFAALMGMPGVFGSRSLFQLGVLSGLAVLYAWATSRVLLPALYRAFGGEHDSVHTHKGLTSKVTRFLASLAIYWSRKSVAGIICTLVITGTMILAMVVVILGKVTIENDPREFLQNAPIGETIREYEKPGQPGGFNTHVVHILPTSVTMNDPQFLSAALQFGDDLRTLSGVRSVVNPADGAVQYAEENFSIAWKTEPEEVLGTVWRDMRNEQLFVVGRFVGDGEHVNGIALVVIGSDASTRGMRELRSAIESAAARYTPVFTAELPGKISLYPEVDGAVTDTALGNVVQSLVLVIFAGGLWLSSGVRRKRMRVLAHKGTIAAVPFILALSALVLVMAVFRIPVDISTAAIGAIAISVAIDMPIFVLVALQSGDEKRVVRELETAVADALVNAPPFLALCLSAFPSVFRFGLLIVTVIIVCAFATLFVMLPLAQKTIGVQE